MTAAVAGAGTGSLPWAHTTVPAPVCTRVATISTGSRVSTARQMASTFSIASPLPTS